MSEATETSERGLQLREPIEAPRDGTFILGAFGWPWLLPAVWNSYDDEWVVCHMQAQPMANGLDDRWFEMEREKASALKGWLPVPPLPGGHVFRPIAKGMATMRCVEAISKIEGLVTTDHETKEAFISRVRGILGDNAKVVGIATHALFGVDGATGCGFPTVTFFDEYGHECSIQESSRAVFENEDGTVDDPLGWIWLGIDDANPQILKTKAREMGMELPPGEVSGWMPYPIPDDVLFTTRMHLNEKQVRGLIARLTAWLETGSLTPNTQSQAPADATPNTIE